MDPCTSTQRAVNAAGRAESSSQQIVYPSMQERKALYHFTEETRAPNVNEVTDVAFIPLFIDPRSDTSL